MAVTRLRTRRDAKEQAGLEAVRDVLESMPGTAELVTIVERKLAAARGWKFVMVEPVLYAEGVEDLLEHSKRPQKAVRLSAPFSTFLPPEDKEVTTSRSELARLAGIAPCTVSEI